MREELYIDGKWTSGTGKSEIEVVNPATEEVIARIPDASEKDLEGAILAARRAVDEGPWGTATPKQRAEILDRFVSVLESHSSVYVDTVIAELGAPRGLRRDYTSESPLLCSVTWSIGFSHHIHS